MRSLLVVAALLVLATAAVHDNDRLRRSLKEEEDEEKQGEIWAVIVAGSSGWYNYRHQADVCHAYQILHQHGVPDDHIIVMMYDDIAHNVENPNQGVIINRPDGPNVYEGVPKDYTGMDVTSENFLKVLRGDSEGLKGVGSGKVLKSGPNDRVFINMVDHGAPGIFAFPHGYLNATDLADTLLAMRQDNKYWQMVMYVESCESGSLFQKLLPDDIEVYAVSASAPNEHSYACYQDNTLHTFLGDVFSIKWMEDTDMENIQQETLKKQFLLVRKEVVTSTVMHWGELRLASQKLSKFLGKKDPHHISNHISNYDYDAYSPSVSIQNDPCLNSSVASYDVPLAILKSRIQTAATTDEEQHWKEELTALRLNRVLVRFVMQRLVREVTGVQATANKLMKKEHHHEISRRACYEDSVRSFHNHCFDLAENPFALRVLSNIVNLCEHGYTHEQFLEAARVVCTHQTYTGIV